MTVVLRAWLCSGFRPEDRSGRLLPQSTPRASSIAFCILLFFLLCLRLFLIFYRLRSLCAVSFQPALSLSCSLAPACVGGGALAPLNESVCSVVPVVVRMASDVNEAHSSGSALVLGRKQPFAPSYALLASARTTRRRRDLCPQHVRTRSASRR